MSEQTCEAAIRDIVEARSQAIGDGDAEAMSANVADEAVMFDVVGPLSSKGGTVSRDRAIQWLAGYAGPVRWETSDVHVEADSAVAFSHNLSDVMGTLKTGTKIDMWFRTTLGFRKNDGRRRIVHDHSSDPFDPATGLASTGCAR